MSNTDELCVDEKMHNHHLVSSLTNEIVMAVVRDLDHHKLVRRWIEDVNTNHEGSKRGFRSGVDDFGFILEPLELIIFGRIETHDWAVIFIVGNSLQRCSE